LELVDVLLAGDDLDAARDVNRVGPHGLDGVRDVVGAKTAREDDVAERARRARRAPVGDEAAATAHLPGRPIEEIGRAGVGREDAGIDPGAGSKRLVPAPRVAPALLGPLVAVELERRQARGVDGVHDGGGRLVHENTDPRDKGRELRDDPSRLARRNVARRLLPEDEADRVHAQEHRLNGVALLRDAADLDLRHGDRSSASAAPGSFARSSDSPTRNARYPALSRRATSPEVRIPLSATFTMPSG